MPDEINDDEVVEPVVEKTPRPENRFKDLSEKVETTAKERDEANAAKEAAEKEVSFYKDFSKLKYSDAIDFQDKIKEKVMAGYDMDDAAISVLTKAGKFNQQAQTQVRQSPAGGSASTSMTTPDDKPVGEMTTAEKKQRLLDIEREQPGTLSQALRTINL